jgi:hypothetical protein
VLAYHKLNRPVLHIQELSVGKHMAKVIAYTALLYGREYLAYAIESIIDYVDEYHVLYASQGSHGHRTSTPCPETRDELYAIASTVAGRKLRWHDGEWGHEGLQRDSIYQYAPDADVIIVCDSDELYPVGLIKRVIEYSTTVTNSIPPVRFIRLPFIHFYRDFNHCILRDPAYPVRVIFPRVDIQYGESTWNPIYARGSVCHMGYCQRSEIIRYKLGIHGHKNELRCSADEYVDTIYLDRNRWTDLHPVGSEHWDAEIVNPLQYLPDWMASHPYFGMEVIE